MKGQMMRVAQAEKTIQHYIHKFEMSRFLNDDLLRHLQLYRFAPYTHVYMEEDEQFILYFLVEGQVQCSHYHANGKLAVYAISTPFTAIGDLEILSDNPINGDVIALEETVMLGISRTVVEQYGTNDPRFLRYIIGELQQKMLDSTVLQTANVLPVINRLAIYLLSYATADAETVSLPDKEELASMIGTTTRHLNRVIKQLVESNIISDTYPRVRILNREALEDLTQ